VVSKGGFYPRAVFGSQLELSLGDVRLKIPWAGRSPRGLTRASNLIILKTQGEKSCLTLGQLDFFESCSSGKNAPRFVYRGAPLLREV